MKRSLRRLPWCRLVCLLSCGSVWGADQGPAPPLAFIRSDGFIVFCGVGVALLALAAFRFCVQRAAARMRARFEERMAEQTCIARELQDTLLQSTQGLILQFQAAVDHMSPEDPARAALLEALDRVEAMLTTGRERVLDLRTSEEPLGDLPVAYAATGEALRQGRNVTFRTIVDGTARDLQPFVKAELYRIGREALLNAFRHAHAATIEIQIVYGEDRLSIRIRDDGTGVDARMLGQDKGPAHWGVVGMQARAARIGARLDFWSRAGAGTEIELRISAALAYKPPSKIGR
ncbi:hypothetical protein GCM10009107_16850 [Ideonella azotifigens]|uniref:Histidine kinase/HSP90-like ATPase domain-containing protein n=2 Tax=Ideonella azotifigens TaxID=513160 RepID=A0ABN1JWC5_9BURK